MSSARGVDRKANTIRGYVVAEAANFKNADRGRFDGNSLKRMIELWPAKGLKSRFAHPDMFHDGLGKLLGRSVNPRISGTKLLADLVFNLSSFNSPYGDLGSYVMNLAESDPDAFSSSLVLDTEYVIEKDSRGRALRDSKGMPLPILWLPTKLYASDVVETGEAVGSFLSKPTPRSVLEKDLTLKRMKSQWQG